MEGWVSYIGPLVGLVGLILTIWWKVETKINTAGDKADTAARDLANYKTHVAETYTTKSGMKEIKEEILGAVSGIRDDVRHLATRIDGMHEAQSKARPRTTLT
ncbi:hypothetical protein F4V91_08715 [Neorhizobium galegae]|uniref:DUF2746 domain-containing protein n=1 Tax=Neorhizobium galegae TaxID=399 RepID=A0A6A1TNU5_NEOGA|nr:hypothetical protein [Neorhizobium galegae]KAB1086501.1 hypothetical protein F4V91_08715 [Neorhizobium galegae]